MWDKSSLLAFIPARGGSKGLPNKNILDCAGKPLIVWTIEAACGVPDFDEVFVSTDCENIAAVARSAGAGVPFLRPVEFATDSASLVDALRHAWGLLRDARGNPYDYVVVLQPTSPLRDKRHISAAIKHYFTRRLTEFDTLASVCAVPRKYGWIMQISADSESDGYIRFCLDVLPGNAQRQHLGEYYIPNGAIFVARGDALASGLYSDRTIPFVMNAADSVDIDTRAEFDAAASLLLGR